jgi:hypothetical protein
MESRGKDASGTGGLRDLRNEENYKISNIEWEITNIKV